MKIDLGFRYALVFFVSLSLAGCTGAGRIGPNSPETHTEAAGAASAGFSPEEMEAKWRDYSTPGEEHTRIAALVGDWNYEVQFFPPPPAAPTKSKGQSSIRWVMGGRFLEQQVTGTFMDQPYEGRGFIGYDKAQHQYRTIWFDNVGTGVMTGSATFNPVTRALVDKGSASCPLTGSMPYRAITTFVDANHFTYETFMTPPGQTEFKSMHIDYYRRGTRRRS